MLALYFFLVVEVCAFVFLVKFIEDYNFKKILKQFSTKDHSLALKRLAQEEKLRLTGKNTLFGSTQRKIRLLNFIILSLDFYNGEYEEFRSLVDERNYEDRFQMVPYFLAMHSLIKKDISSAQTYLDAFRSSTLSASTKDRLLLLAESLLAYQKGDVVFAENGAKSLDGSQNLFVSHICAGILEGREIEPFHLPATSTVLVKTLDKDKLAKMKKRVTSWFFVLFFVAIYVFLYLQLPPLPH